MHPAVLGGPPSARSPASRYAPIAKETSLQANRLTIHILAAVVEHDARMISERTKAALSATAEKRFGCI
jgi:DNA invertase Pin-like site-specific DNA recombinase